MVEKYMVVLSVILTIVFEVIAMILGNHGNTSGEITSFGFILKINRFNFVVILNL